MTSVIIYHNVQRECGTCGQPVINLGSGEYAHRRSGAGHIPADAYRPGGAGYQPGHAVVKVFETEAPDGQSPDQVAGQMLAVLGETGGAPDGAYQGYAERGLRPFITGDVIEIGGTCLARQPIGFRPVPAKLAVVWTGDRRSVPLPHCAYCLTTGDDTTLEPVNQAGNLACRDMEACTARWR